MIEYGWSEVVAAVRRRRAVAPVAFKELVRKHGNAKVGEVMGIAPGSVDLKRSGHRPISLDELYALGAAFPEFDLLGTVKILGAKRRKIAEKKRGKA